MAHRGWILKKDNSIHWEMADAIGADSVGPEQSIRALLYFEWWQMDRIVRGRGN